MLIEAGPRVLAGFPDDLSAYAQRSLEARRRGRARHSRSPNATPTAWSMAATRSPRSTIDLGRRRHASPRRRMAGRAGRPGRPRDGRARPHRAGPSRHLRHRRHRRRSPAPTASRCPASRRPPSSRDATSPQLIRARLRGGTLAALPLPARRQSRHDRQARGGDRFRLDQAARPHRLVDLGHRPHLLPDRPRNRLGVALSWLWIHVRASAARG